MKSKKQYLGDGVYADYDGWQIVLTTERERGTETIYLEPQLMDNLIRYYKHIRAAERESNGSAEDRTDTGQFGVGS